jgi:hypothetical protein
MNSSLRRLFQSIPNPTIETGPTDLPISNRTLRSILPSAVLLLCAATAFAATVTGTVTDKTTGKPSSGDTIAVINTAQSMDEIAKVTSDSNGKFQVTAPDGGQILLHVTHKGAEYFKSVPPGSASVDVDVYDSAAKVSGVTGEALVLRAETDTTGKMLNVSENFFVQNASAPPRTQYGGNTLDFFLPKGAQIMQSLASSPGGLPTNTKVVPVDAASGHYAFTFPIRPGETRFQVAYSLPYSGKQAFSIKLSVPTGDVAVMLPKTMQFDGGAQFQPINPDPNSQSYDAHSPSATQPIVFTVSGTGQLPNESPQGGSQSAADQSAGGTQPGQTAASGPRPGGGLGAPIDPGGANDADPWAKYKWWIIGLLGLALAGGAGVMLKANPATADAGTAPLPPVDITVPSAFAPAVVAAPVVAAAGANPLLQALKDELFELETDRLAGKLTPAQYAEHKAAFDVVLRRALSRSESA